MRKIWVASIISLAVVVTAMYYWHHRSQALSEEKRRFEASVAPEKSAPVAALPPKPVHVEEYSTPDEEEAKPLNIAGVDDEECCPEEKADELFKVHSETFDDLPASSRTATTAKSSIDDGLTRDERIRRAEVKRYGDTPDVHRYVDLLLKILNKEWLNNQELLAFARLSQRFQPSAEGQALLDKVEELDGVPDDMRTGWVKIEP